MNNIYIVDDNLFERITLNFNIELNTFILNDKIYSFRFKDYNCIEITWNEFDINVCA